MQPLWAPTVMRVVLAHTLSALMANERWLWAAPSRGRPSPSDARHGRDCWSSETRSKADSAGQCASPPWLWLWLSSGSPSTAGLIQGQPPPSE
eukprot:815628-Rhodomonas_salina.2